MAARSLLVVMYDTVVGRIDQRSPTREPEFTYESEYAATGATPLGIRMPVADTTYRGRYVRSFLEGVLPEEPRTRQRWGSQLGVDPNDTVAILAQMGWDCPGAVQFCLPDALAEMQARSSALERVSDHDLEERLRTLRTSSTASWTLPEEHWSLPGQQAKFALTRRRDGWYESRGSGATTHILKPGIDNLHHQALVEHVTMAAGRELGLDVADTEFTHFGDETAIVIERYDRIVREDSSVLRLHQEDFCSASGRLPAKKYEAHGGPGLADMARIIDQNADDRAISLRKLGDFAAFNYISGAPDGHAKNLSLMLLPDQTRVAPLYDLATSLAYDGNTALREVAVSIGGRRKFGQVMGKNWDRAAATLGIPAEQFRTRVRQLAAGFPDAFFDALLHVGTPEAEEVRLRATGPITAHVKHLIERLDDPVERP